MSANGLEVFDKSLQTTHVWLNEITDEIGPDRQLAWHVLGVVLRTLRDRIPPGLAAHLGAQLPLLVRGAYYDQYRPNQKLYDAPGDDKSREAFLQHIAEGLEDVRPVDAEDAVKAVLHVLSHHLPEGQVRKTRDALPKDIQPLWLMDSAGRGLPH